MLHQKKTSLSDFASLNCCAAVVGGTLLALYRNTPAIWFAEKFPDHTNQSGCSLEMTCRIGAIQQNNPRACSSKHLLEHAFPDSAASPQIFPSSQYTEVVVQPRLINGQSGADEVQPMTD